MSSVNESPRSNELSATASSTRPPLRAFFPVAATMLAVFGALMAQQAVIDAAQRWRER